MKPTEEHIYSYNSSEGTKIPLPFSPDMVHCTFYKFNDCSLCSEEKAKNPDFDSKDCIHCKTKTQIHVCCYSPIKKDTNETF